MNTLPADYASTGRRVGDLAPAFTDAPDQFGNTDVALGQFAGGMTVLNVGAEWCGPCQAAAENSQALWSEINGSQSDFNYWEVEVLIEDGSGRVSTLETAERWASTYGLQYPIIWGSAANDIASDFGVTALPTLVLLDPNLQIREIQEGWGGDASFARMIESGYEEFIAENPDWEPVCPDIEIEEGCGNNVIEGDEECDGGAIDESCRTLDTPRAVGEGIACTEGCELDTSGCGLAYCETMGGLSAPASGTLACNASGFYWDLYEITVAEGDCIHVKVDNGDGAADVAAFAVDPSGRTAGGAADYMDLDDEGDCSVDPWDGAACVDSALTAESAGTMLIAVTQWGGEGCVDGAAYTLDVSVNGADLDLSAGPVENDVEWTP